jgi:hypothetical protein
MDNGIASIPPATWIWWQRRRSRLSAGLNGRRELIADGAEGHDIEQRSAGE